MNWSKRPFVFLINFLEHMLSASLDKNLLVFASGLRCVLENIGFRSQSMSQLFPWLLSVLVYVYALLVSFGFFWFLLISFDFFLLDLLYY